MFANYQNLSPDKDGDAIEDGDATELKGKIKDLVELSMRMVEVAKSTSEWHRRMTSQNLSQNGRKINLDDYNEVTKVYFYKPPSASEADKRGRKAKLMEVGKLNSWIIMLVLLELLKK